MQTPVYPGAIQRPYRMPETWTDDMQAAETAARLDNLEPGDDPVGVRSLLMDPEVSKALAINADLYRRAFALVESWGFEVAYWDGWETTSASMTASKIVRPVAVINHHTASNLTPTRYIRYGDAARGLAGPLANVHVERSGKAIVLGVGYQNHAGNNHKACFDRIAGGTAPLDRDLIPGPDDAFSANRWAVAIEANGDGGADDWTAEQHAVIDAINAAFHIVCEWSLDGKTPRSGSHEELTPRKPGDPTMSMGDLRREVAALVTEKTAPATGRPAGTPPLLYVGMTRSITAIAWTKHLQRGLLRVFPSYASPIAAAGGVDGWYGKATAGVVAEFQRRTGLLDDGKCGSATWSELAKHGI